MPVNKNSLRRYRIEDRLLSDPNYSYTTEMILRRVNSEMSDDEKVELRMIQKDIKALELYFGKEMVRGEGGRGTVRYADQSSPLFYQQLTEDEANVLREALMTLGQFDGLDNFTWLDLLKKKLMVDNGSTQTTYPLISFSKNDGLQVKGSLLARLFTAISRRQVIKVRYKKFGQSVLDYDLYPYQLKQYNSRWYLLATPLGNEYYPYRPDFVINLALDRIVDFSLVDDRGPYIDTPVDLSNMYEEVVGITLDSSFPESEDIFFAASPSAVEYIRTKLIHSSQIEITGKTEQDIKSVYPSLSGWTIFSICCRINKELLSLLCSYGENLVVLDIPDGHGGIVENHSTLTSMIMERVSAAADIYRRLDYEFSIYSQKSKTFVENK